MTKTTLEDGRRFLGEENGENSTAVPQTIDEQNTAQIVDGQLRLTGESTQILLSETPEQEKEKQLNCGITREKVLREQGCELIKVTPELLTAFHNLRRGYPEQPYARQCRGHEFRYNADLIIDEIASNTMRGFNPEKTVVLMPWRAGLAFGPGFVKQGVKRFYHVSSRRDEETLKTIVDYEAGHIEPEDTVVMADPMLATGNTGVDAIERMLANGLTPERIVVNAVVAAPVGVHRMKKYPGVRVVAGFLDSKLDHRGYIVPGLGDFGDKYFENFTAEERAKLCEMLGIDRLSKLKLYARFRSHLQDQDDIQEAS